MIFAKLLTSFLAMKLFKPLLFFIEKHLGALIIRLLGVTYRLKTNGYPKNKKCIYCFWHQRLIAMIYFRRNQKNVVLVSKSDDGQMVAGPLQALGYLTVRGSSSRGGSSAVRTLLKHAKNHSLALTPDGPKGPAKKVKSGVTYLAYASKLPIIPVEIQVNKYWQFNTWDKMIVPKPFARITITYKPEIYIETKQDIENKTSFIESQLN